MRRISAALVVLVMLAMCALSFGNYFLIYNVSATVNGADDDTGVKTTVPMKGYLVVNLTDDDGDFVDANLILYGNDSSTPKKQKVYVVLNYNSDEFLDVESRVIGDFAFMDITGSGPFNFEMLISGKQTLKDIGKGTLDKKNVPSSIKGNLIVRTGFLLGPDAEQDVAGTANVSATLWAVATKWVNGANDEHVQWTQDEILSGRGEDDGLIGILEGKLYRPAVLPLP
jgi:hypothetical protein